ncbi:40961_t:CDS:2, partial [Gigaspora margarita]
QGLSKLMPSEFEHQDLVLVEATPGQAKITNRNSYMSWGYPMLTINEYIEHEEIHVNNEFISKNFKVWILVSKIYNLSNDIEQTIFSQYETYKLKALITIPSRQIREVMYQHKGYATKLIELLNDKLRFECKTKFSYLYSEIVDNRFSTYLKHSELIIAINQSNIETTINKDCEFIKKELKKLNKKCIVILPTKPAFDWLFQKTKLYSKLNVDTNNQRQF